MGNLLSKLVQFGVIKEDVQQQNDHRPSPPPPLPAHPPAAQDLGPAPLERKPLDQPLLNVPNLSFTPATLKQ